MSRNRLSPDPCFLFDNANASCGGRVLMLQNPVEIVRADTPLQVRAALQRLEMAMEKGLYAAGFFSYELGYALEPSLLSLMPADRRVPLLWFALFREIQVLKGGQSVEFFAGHLSDDAAAGLQDMRPALDKAAYQQRFERVKRLICQGDIYQVNLAFKLLFTHQGEPLSLYAHLRRRQPVSCGAFLDAPEFAILSLSPELFFKVEKGRIITRPMKGTMARGQSREEDLARRKKLHNDQKNRAENLMIVDLMRNDLARICEAGSIRVSDLYRIEALPTLFQMTSGVSGKLRRDIGLEEMLKALLPAGSITGAPKIRAQEVIRELEDQPRGAYCGAMGIISRDQATGQLSALFNVAIRTLTLFPDASGETGIGSGIVQDSQVQDEYEECLLKARFLSAPDFKLIETMRLDEDGRYYLLERHLSRLVRSCRQYGFLYNDRDIRKGLESLAGSLGKGCFLVRLVLDTGGRFDLSASRIEPPDPDRQIAFVISKERVDSANELLAHKTTKRQLFDREWQRASEHEGADEVLFLNERDELTEGARTNLFVEREDGLLATPPLFCGLLPGTLRAQLLSEGRALEQVLMLEDLRDRRIYFGNSVRGLQPAAQISPKGGWY